MRAALTALRLEGMDTTADHLAEVTVARAKREELAARLRAQDRYVGHVVRAAHAAGATYRQIGQAGGMSDVAALKAARRPEE